jgi:hypothetical protein
LHAGGILLYNICSRNPFLTSGTQGRKKKKHTRKVQKSKNLNSTLTLDNYLMIKYYGLVMKNTLENFKSSSNALITFLGTKSKYARCTAGFSAKT